MTRPEIDEPTVKVAEPRRAIIKADQAGELEEDLALDLQRKPRLDLLAGWAGAARGVDPFKVGACTQGLPHYFRMRWLRFPSRFDIMHSDR